MTDLPEYPLVTFALFAYNQEKYIREAVEGALAQTYEPLQIIISDDCSTDSTFNIISRIAEEYTGPHKLVLNRNNTNLGIGSHINKVMTLSEGDLIIVAAGDDISSPNRSKIIFDVWNETGRQDISIFSAMREIDRNSCTTGKVYRSLREWGHTSAEEVLMKNLGVFGASHAWSSNLFSEFQPMSSNIINEDHVIPFRAALLDGINYVDEVLVSYRANIGIASNYSDSVRLTLIQKRAPSMLIRPYRVSVQRGRDLTDAMRLDLVKASRVRRAEDLFRYWIASRRRVTNHRIRFFAKRCRIIWLAKEIAYEMIYRLAKEFK